MTKKIIPVTKPSMPPLSEFIPYLEKIWDSQILTNSGPFHSELENKLADFLGVQYVSLFSNATIALITAMQCLRITGSVITTPFSFVATSHSLLWNNIKPIFVDISPDTFNIDSKKIASAISADTTAILPVHCYGEPCEVDSIQEIADTFGLKVIYDASHAFGVNNEEGHSILNSGDLSILSFHATKVFNTFEGGAIISKDPKTKARIDYLKNFGFADEITVVMPGINGKMNEVQASFGLLQLKYVEEFMKKRQAVDSFYREKLSGLQGVTIPTPSVAATQNYSYFPILINENYSISRDELYDALKGQGILARRYFYPLISDMPMYKDLKSAAPSNLPNAHKVAKQILCLPIYPDLSFADQSFIVDSIIRLAH